MVSQSKGSEILGLNRSEFLDLLSRYRISRGHLGSIALAKTGFARRSQSAGRFGNPFRVPIKIGAGEGT